MREAPGAEEKKRLQTILRRRLRRVIGFEMSVLFSNSYFVFDLEDPAH